MKYVCKICGFIYDEATQEKKWNELDENWVCPVCKAPKSKFEAVNENSGNKYAGTKTEKNLMEAFAGESMARNKYTYFAKAAREEGFEEIASVLDSIAIAEKHHEARYLKLLEALENGTTFKREAPVVWKCNNCGFIYEGLEAPERCPACDHPQAHFEVNTFFLG